MLRIMLCRTKTERRQERRRLWRDPPGLAKEAYRASSRGKSAVRAAELAR